MARPFNIAHRGGAGLWPENTLFALENAARAGYDGAEIDVQLTKDGRLACFHDFKLKPELCRGPDGSWLTRREARRLPPIWRLTYEDLSAFDVGRVDEVVPLLCIEVEPIHVELCSRSRFRKFGALSGELEERANP